MYLLSFLEKGSFLSSEYGMILIVTDKLYDELLAERFNVEIVALMKKVTKILKSGMSMSAVSRIHPFW